MLVLLAYIDFRKQVSPGSQDRYPWKLRLQTSFLNTEVLVVQEMYVQPEMPRERQPIEPAAPRTQHTYDDDDESMLAAALEVGFLTTH